MAGIKIVKVGPWGGSDGDLWEFILDGRLAGIKIRSGVVVDAISFSFKDGRGDTYESAKFGGDGGSLYEISFGDDEEIIKISGTFGTFEEFNNVVTSLTLETNKKTYGRYGSILGTDFSLPIIEGKIVGFHGRSSILLDAIGVALSP